MERTTLHHIMTMRFDFWSNELISEIVVRGIKSVIDEVSIPCAALTILTGANSAGKSTFLQALLTIKQTHMAPPQGGTLRLNGEFVRLGTADIVSADTARLGLNIFGKILSLALVGDGKDLLVDKISFDGARFCHIVEPESDLTDFLISHDLAGGVYSYGDSWVLFNGITPRFAISRVIGLSSEQRNELERAAAEYLLGTLREVLEYELAGANELDRRWRQLAIQCCRRGELEQAIAFTLRIGEMAPEAQIEDPSLSHSLRTLLPPRHQQYVADIRALVDVRDLEDHLTDHRASLPSPSFEIVELPGPAVALRAWLERICADTVYLGPLREDPRLIHEDHLVTEPGRLGTKGNNMVALLRYRGLESIEALVPFDPNAAPKPSEMRQRMPLLDGINLWIRYLGIGHEVIVGHHQPYGLTIEIRPTPDLDPVLLTNVGVGVSQVLPILTAGLTSTCGQMVILEQPELHLHPAVQTRVADFLLGLALIGVQVVVETHSEHLINRARMMVARGLVDPSMLSLLFLSRDEYGTEVEQIEVDEHGRLEAWPEGFFDETEKVLLSF